MNRQDAEAFAVLVERHGPALYKLAFRLTGNLDDAQDVVQEAFYRGYRRLNSFEGRADAGTWLHRIVVNCALDQLRRARSRPEREPMDHTADLDAHASSHMPDPERLAQSAETGQRITAALSRLTPSERIAFTLRHFEGCTIEEIARTLGTTGNAAKQHIFRGVRKLRGALDAQRSHR